MAARKAAHPGRKQPFAEIVLESDFQKRVGEQIRGLGDAADAFGLVDEVFCEAAAHLAALRAEPSQVTVACFLQQAGLASGKT